jgi:hypothetical protein
MQAVLSLLDNKVFEFIERDVPFPAATQKRVILDFSY